MDEHPGVYFCDGQTGRRARLVGGPDVQDVIRAVRATREAEPELDSASVVRLVAANTGVPARLIEVAVRYWSAYPDEIDTWIIQANKFEDEAFAAWQRQQRLLPAR